MGFNTQAIRYGWVALASLGVITGTTIYVELNTRRQVKPEDTIEIALGTYERCLATQYSTNPVAYHVSPPSFVRTWYSNVYTTNGVTIYTNIVTNTIGWHIDRDMMVSLDATIKALIPYYADTNTVYDGTTNIVMLTVTGLWDQLKIGDGGMHVTTNTNTMVVTTNWGSSFTRTPCWTNTVSTNWIVNYTSYWPSTNGTATNINYTSDYRQVINYAQSWTATGGHVWVTSSNWMSSVVTVTNTATYGDYPWQIYVEDLQERYKVLNALKMINISSDLATYTLEGKNTFSQWPTNDPWEIFTNTTPMYKYGELKDATALSERRGAALTRTRVRAQYEVQLNHSTNTPILTLSAYLLVTKVMNTLAYYEFVKYFNFNDVVCPGTENTYMNIINLSNPSNNQFPYRSSTFYGDSNTDVFDKDPPLGSWEMYAWFMTDRRVFILFNFQYCTNKYW